jgi:hypothetical protein
MSKIVDITVTPTVTAGAYSAKDVVGGLLTFANAVSVYKGYGILRKIVIKNNAGVADLLNIHLFNTAPASIADNAAYDPTDAEMATCIATIPIVAADYVIATDNAIATKLLELPFVVAPYGTSLYVYVSTVATPTYAAVTDFAVTLTIER